MINKNNIYFLITINKNENLRELFLEKVHTLKTSLTRSLEMIFIY
jgi:hypothetical protein